MRAVQMTAVGGPEVLGSRRCPSRGSPATVTSWSGSPPRASTRSTTSCGPTGRSAGRCPPCSAGTAPGWWRPPGPASPGSAPGTRCTSATAASAPCQAPTRRSGSSTSGSWPASRESLSFVEAAAAPLVTIIAWEALLERARVGKDQLVLVQAGAGGVGHMAVQVARLAGARVATTVTPGPKADLAAALGAELCIDYRHADVGAAVRAWTGADGADVVHDTVGGKTFTSSFSLVRPYGDLVSNVESPWEEEAVKVMHDRNLRVSFAWMPAPAVFGWDAAPGTPAEDPGAGRRVLRRGRATGPGRRDVPARARRRRAPRPGGRPGHRQGRPHDGIPEAGAGDAGGDAGSAGRRW